MDGSLGEVEGGSVGVASGAAYLGLGHPALISECRRGVAVHNTSGGYST